MIVTLALRNLAHDKVRLLATLFGVAFSVILMIGQSAIYAGASKTITTMIDQSQADLWIMPVGSQSFEDGLPLLTDSDRQRTTSTNGVKSVTPIVAAFANWMEPSGVIDVIVLVGSDPDAGGPRPAVSPDNGAELAGTRSVIVDRRYLNALGVKGVGDAAGIGDFSVRVTGLSEGIRSFTQSPYVFAKPEQARKYLGVPSGSTTFLLVKTEPTANVGNVQRTLSMRLSNVDVLTTPEFRARSLDTWLMKTGAGQALIIGTILGAIIGASIVAQTINMSVRDHESEFALLRCMGSSISYVQSIVLIQALAIAATGAAIGIGLFLPTVPLSRDTPLFLMITPRLLALVIVATFGISLVSSIGAMNKLKKLDPAILVK